MRAKPPAVPSLVDIGSRLSADQIRDGRDPWTRPHAGISQIVRGGSGFARGLSFPSAAGAGGISAKAATETANHPRSARKTSVSKQFRFHVHQERIPAIAPPWTTLTAYDLNQGTIKWQVPLGEVPELAAKGFKRTGSHFPKVGPVVTAGGLIFTGTRDSKVRALDSSTGKVLWEAKVGAALEGMPAVYQIEGREYIVFCAAARLPPTLTMSPATRQCRLHTRGLCHVCPTSWISEAIMFGIGDQTGDNFKSLL